MKCPKCGTQVKPGSLYCHKCLHEIQWVPEYSTVETLLKEKETNKQKIKHKVKRKLSISRKRILAGAVLLAAAVLCIAVWVYRNHSYPVQYGRAQKAYLHGEYSLALEYADKAMILSPRKAGATLLMAKTLQAQGELSGAIKVLEGSLQYHKGNRDYYMQLISLYEENEEPDKIKQLITHTDNEWIRSSFAYYLCPDPEITPETGIYEKKLKAAVREEEGIQYYYTLDGSQPTSESALYRKPIRIKEGVTELKVMGINSFGITSDVLYRKYTVVLEDPDPPDISPESGIYGKDMLITVEVPDGYHAYYAFDEYPTADSMEYTAPVKMPEGEHTFYAILMAGNDKESDVASRDYYLDY